MKNILVIAALLLLAAGCKKHSATQTSAPPAPAHIFKGISVINDVGQITGVWGTEDDDWRNDAKWTAEEFALLSFPDTISLNGTYIRDTTGWNVGPGIHERPQNIVITYPNPVYDFAEMVYRGLGLLKFKAVIVDKNYNRMFTFCCKDSMASLLLDLSDTAKFKSGTIYRMYYTLSAKDSVNFFKGHGDILVCRQASPLYCKGNVP
ncbi:MAG: hypothetical protein WCO44_15995 [Bacteroidota bacterium]